MNIVTRTLASVTVLFIFYGSNNAVATDHMGALFENQRSVSRVNVQMLSDLHAQSKQGNINATRQLVEFNNTYLKNVSYSMSIDVPSTNSSWASEQYLLQYQGEISQLTGFVNSLNVQPKSAMVAAETLGCYHYISSETSDFANPFFAFYGQHEPVRRPSISLDANGQQVISAIHYSVAYNSNCSQMKGVIVDAYGGLSHFDSRRLNGYKDFMNAGYMVYIVNLPGSKDDSQFLGEGIYTNARNLFYFVASLIQNPKGKLGTSQPGFANSIDGSTPLFLMGGSMGGYNTLMMPIISSVTGRFDIPALCIIDPYDWPQIIPISGWEPFKGYISINGIHDITREWNYPYTVARKRSFSIQERIKTGAKAITSVQGKLSGLTIDHANPIKLINNYSSLQAFRSPILFVVGGVDNNVHPQHSLNAYDTLKFHGKKNTYMNFYTNRGHSAIGYQVQAVNFMNSVIENGQNPNRPIVGYENITYQHMQYFINNVRNPYFEQYKPQDVNLTYSENSENILYST